MLTDVKIVTKFLLLGDRMPFERVRVTAVGRSQFNSFLTITGKFSVMRGTLLYVFGSCERHSELTEEMHIPLRPLPKEDTPSSMVLLLFWGEGGCCLFVGFWGLFFFVFFFFCFLLWGCCFFLGGGEGGRFFF